MITIKNDKGTGTHLIKCIKVLMMVLDIGMQLIWQEGMMYKED